MREDRELALSAGMDDYVTKPVKREKIEEALERWLPSEQDPPLFLECGESSVDSEAAGDPLNRAAIENLRELGGDEMLVELTEMFIDDAASSLSALKKSVEHGDTTRVERVAHTLKGSSGNMGATRMADICSELEQAGASKDMADAPAQLERLEAEFERVRLALDEEIEAG